MNKNVVILSGLILGLSSCIQTKYFVKKESELYFVYWEGNTSNYIPFIDSILENSPLLDSTYHLIVQKKFLKLNNYLSLNQATTPEYYLAKTLYHISKTEYIEASAELKMINQNCYELLKDLISLDLDYELAKANGIKDYKKYLQDYQYILDKYPDNEYLKKIIALRTRYIRYNY